MELSPDDLQNLKQYLRSAFISLKAISEEMEAEGVELGKRVRLLSAKVDVLRASAVIDIAERKDQH